jgi:hypothetical protein
VNPAIVSDGSGGAIIFWADNRGSSSFSIYGQRLDAGGNPLWAANGVQIATHAQSAPIAVSDGQGGAMVAYEESTPAMVNGSSYTTAQRVNGSGTLLWGGGVALSTVNSLQSAPVILSDFHTGLLGVGPGAMVAWADARSG